MGLLDEMFFQGQDVPRWDQPGYKPRWRREPANDKRHPWVGIGLLDQLRAQGPPPLPPEADVAPELFGDRIPYAHRIPPPWADERAYNPTLQYEDSAPGVWARMKQFRDYQAKVRAQDFLRPKTADEVYGVSMLRKY